MRVEAVDLIDNAHSRADGVVGVIVPLGLDIARLTNFAGYVSWCAWLVAMAIVLWRDKLHADGSASPSATVRHRNPAHS